MRILRRTPETIPYCDRKMTILILGLCLNCGCDRMHYTWQTVRVRIADPRTAEGMNGALVELAQPPLRIYAHDPEGWLDRVAETAICNSDGVATIDRRNTILAPGLFPGLIPGPDLRKDYVSGSRFIARVTDKKVSETLSLQMTLNKKVRGEIFEIQVLEIGRPRRRK